MNAQQILNAAFHQLVQDEIDFDYDIPDEAFEWKSGEAEDWLKQIASGEKVLSVGFRNNGGAVWPCLR